MGLEMKQKILKMQLQFEILCSCSKSGLMGISGYKILLFSHHSICKALVVMNRLDSVLWEKVNSLRLKKKKSKPNAMIKTNFVFVLVAKKWLD